MLKFIQRCTIRQWFIVGVVNLLIVGGVGFLMRLKIIFPLPWGDQKFLMHAHSHFAFAGWVSHVLMVFIVLAMYRLKQRHTLPRRYQYIVAASLFFSYGMLVAFALQGYALYSIIFSTCSILVSFVFAACCWLDLRRSDLPHILKYWFRAAVFFSVLSSLGTFSLVRLMATYPLDPLKQLASVYFYLHFQYNGWFLFSCVGLLLYWLYDHSGIAACSKRLFWLFFFCVIPAYFLSVLWWKAFPDWLYGVVVGTVLLQLVVWGRLVYVVLYALRGGDLRTPVSPVTSWLWLGVMSAVFLKFILQAASVVPSLSQLVYGYRPIVIAYLHLVLLVIISLFIIGFAFQIEVLRFSRGVHLWVMVLAGAVVLNELVLTIQGISGLIRVYVPFMNHLLALAAGLIVCALWGILRRQGRLS